MNGAESKFTINRFIKVPFFMRESFFSVARHPLNALGEDK